MSPTRRDNWIDDDEYPDDDDVGEFGENSPYDYDPQSIGTVENRRPRFWTTGRLILLVIVVVVVASLLLPRILPLLR
jgi:hypothetical protein